MSEGVDRCYPAASGGFYPPEVVQDFDKRPERDVTPATPRGGAKALLTQEEIDQVHAVAGACAEFLAAGSAADAAVEMDNAGFSAEQKVYFWDQFDAKDGKLIAAELKKQRAERKALAAPAAPAEQDVTQAIPDASPVISAAQHKRLEARIKELGADRDKLKAYVQKEFGIAHLNELTKDAYQAVDKMLDAKERKAATGPTVAAEQTLSDRIKACATLAELDALSEALTGDDVGIYFDAVAKRKSELAGDAPL